jgi:hypothetical protein
LLYALERELTLHFGRACSVKRLLCRTNVYSSSYTILNLSVDLSRGRVLRLALKDLSPDSLLSAARAVRPSFLYDPAREIETYRTLLNPRKLGTPVCYGAVNDPERQRYWLFLERVSGPLLWQVGSMDTWQEAARWLARLHSAFSGISAASAAAGQVPLLCYTEELFGTWRIRAEAFLCQQKALRTSDLFRRFFRIMSRYDRVIDRLSALPVTLVHGEFYPSNVIVRRTSGRGRICPIDWEVAAVAPGLIDLAALCSGEWSMDQQKLLVSAYLEEVRPTGPKSGALREAIDSVLYCQLHLAVQMLGWAADWSPPKHHARNWLREAVRLGDALGL